MSYVPSSRMTIKIARLMIEDLGTLIKKGCDRGFDLHTQVLMIDTLLELDDLLETQSDTGAVWDFCPPCTNREEGMLIPADD